MDEFLCTLGSNLPPTENGDRVKWKLKNGDFDICSFYNKLRGPLPIIFPWKGIWRVKAPRHVFFFVWIAIWDKIFTGNNLEGLILLTGALCVSVMGRQWIICYFIVERPISCGVWFLDLLGFHGSCQDQLQLLFLVGGIGLESTRLHLEFSSIVLNVVYLEGSKLADV